MLKGMHWRGYLLVVLALLVFAGLFFASPFLQELFSAISKDTSNYAAGHPFAVILFFILLAALSAMVSPFSSVPVVPFAVAFWGVNETILLLLVGWLIGGTCAYVVGKYAAHPLIAQFMKEDRLTKYEHSISERMTFSRALLIRLALPAEVGYAFGLIRYDFVKYIIVTLAAELPFAFLSVHAAEAFLALDALRFAGWVFLLVLLVGVSYLVFRGRKSRIA